MKYLFAFMTITLFASCTITKRIHNPGWHVEWKSSLTKPQAQDHPSTSSVNLDSLVENSTAQTTTNNPTTNEMEAEVEQVNESRVREAVDTKDVIKDENQNVEIKKAEPTSVDHKQTLVFSPKQPRVDPLGILSIISGSTALIFFLNICLLLSDNGWNAILGLSYPWLFFITLVFAVIGLILAIKSIKRIRQNPELYKGKARAWTGFGISVGGIGLVVLLLLIIALVFLFETFFYW